MILAILAWLVVCIACCAGVWFMTDGLKDWKALWLFLGLVAAVLILSLACAYLEFYYTHPKPNPQPERQ